MLDNGDPPASWSPPRQSGSEEIEDPISAGHTRGRGWKVGGLRALWRAGLHQGSDEEGLADCWLSSESRSTPPRPNPILDPGLPLVLRHLRVQGKISE